MIREAMELIQKTKEEFDLYPDEKYKLDEENGLLFVRNGVSMDIFAVNELLLSLPNMLDEVVHTASPQPPQLPPYVQKEIYNTFGFYDHDSIHKSNDLKTQFCYHTEPGTVEVTNGYPVSEGGWVRVGYEGVVYKFQQCDICRELYYEIKSTSL